MANIVLKHIEKVYPGNVKAVHDFNLEIEDREFIILVGPSGCGKSTTLRITAGLEEISSGELFIDDRLVNNVEPKDRDIAMVFQNYALYPHMTVYKNMAFSLQLRKMPKAEIEKKVTEAAKILDIEHLLNRKPKALSGGQRQRVALGRAMVRDPAVFLLDEPLSNLDAKLRTAMRSEIAKLHHRLKETGTTFVYVTHDQVEAMTMADRIVVMKDGFLQQVDTPQNLYDFPCNEFVAGFIGSPQMNFFTSKLEKRDSGFVAIFHDTEIVIPPAKYTAADLDPYVGKELTVGVRAENLKIEEVFLDMPTSSTITLDVDLAEMMGSEIFLYATVHDTKVIAKIPPRHKLHRGEQVTLAIDGNHLHLFDKETTERIGPGAPSKN